MRICVHFPVYPPPHTHTQYTHTLLVELAFFLLLALWRLYGNCNKLQTQKADVMRLVAGAQVSSDNHVLSLCVLCFSLFCFVLPFLAADLMLVLHFAAFV